MPITVRCAVYARKSTEVVADQPMTSLEAQRDVCRAYIRCNEHRGWLETGDCYEDVGYSGATLERPALRRLLDDIAAGEIDVVVIYKIDRLTRSLSDFVRLSEALSQTGVAFVSVTQLFDTSDAMGRMILNILLTFAQFEREMLSDRIKDKLRSMRLRGMFVNGHPPLGYDKVGCRLVINIAEAKLVRSIFERFDKFPTAFALLQQLRAEGVRHKRIMTRSGKIMGGTLIHHGTFYQMLRNRLYIGEIRDNGEWKPASHDAIIDQELFEKVQALHEVRRRPIAPWDPGRNPLRGLLQDVHARPLKLASGGGGKRRYRYYVSEPKELRRGKPHPKTRASATALEALVKASLITVFEEPEHVRAMLEQSRHAKAAFDAHACCTLVATLKQGSPLLVRNIYEVLLARVIVADDHVILRIDPAAVSAALRQSGSCAGLSPAQDSARLYDYRVNADLICAHRDFRLPIKTSTGGQPDPKLVNLLNRAFRAHQAVMAQRAIPIEVIARQHKLGPSKFSRLLRLTYLAPDIQTAIMDGTHPPDLTAHRLIYAPLPLDWPQQRQILGFAEPTPCSSASTTSSGT